MVLSEPKTNAIFFLGRCCYGCVSEYTKEHQDYYKRTVYALYVSEEIVMRYTEEKGLAKLIKGYIKAII